MISASAQASTQSLAAALRRQAVQAGTTTPAVRGSDWYRAVVATVGTDGTVTTTDGIVARRDEAYQAPAIADIIRVTVSSAGAAVALGRYAGATAPNGAWTTPALATGFAHNGNGNGNAQYRCVTVAGSTFMQWRGGITVTYVSNAIQNGGALLSAALAASLRPAVTRSLTAPCSANGSSSLSVKVDATTDGQVRIVGTTSASTDTYATPVIRPAWVALNGLQYTLD